MAQAPKCLFQFGKPPKQIGELLYAQFECEDTAKNHRDASLGGNDEFPGTPSLGFGPHWPALFSSDLPLFSNCMLSGTLGGRPMLCIRCLAVRRCKKEEIGKKIK